MTVTNTIRDEVTYSNEDGWSETPLTNKEIEEKLLEEEKTGFLSFAWGCWVTAYARNNLIKNIMKLDDYMCYADTDSVKVVQGYDKQVIDNYNKFVKHKIDYVSKVLEIPVSRFAPKDCKGISRMLGLYDDDGHYEEFKTLGAKKYAYKQYNKDGELETHITVSGVPKRGAVALHDDLNNFKNDLVFDYKDTGKQLLYYTEEQEPVILKDYKGNEYQVYDKSGCCIIPNTYTLGMSKEYSNLLNQSSDRAVYIEEL